MMMENWSSDWVGGDCERNWKTEKYSVDSWIFTIHLSICHILGIYIAQLYPTSLFFCKFYLKVF